MGRMKRTPFPRRIRRAQYMLFGKGSENQLRPSLGKELRWAARPASCHSAVFLRFTIGEDSPRRSCPDSASSRNPRRPRSASSQVPKTRSSIGWPRNHPSPRTTNPAALLGSNGRLRQPVLFETRSPNAPRDISRAPGSIQIGDLFRANSGSISQIQAALPLVAGSPSIPPHRQPIFRIRPDNADPLRPLMAPRASSVLRDCSPSSCVVVSGEKRKIAASP